MADKGAAKKRLKEIKEEIGTLKARQEEIKGRLVALRTERDSVKAQIADGGGTSAGK